MKLKLIVLLLGTVLMVGTIKAQTIEQKITTSLSAAPSTKEKTYAIHDLLQIASNTRESLKAEGAKAQARLDDINTQSTNYKNTVTRHNDAAIAHDQKVALHDGRTITHNNNRCTYTDNNESSCSAYNNEQTVLNSEAAYLDRERDQINQEKATLDAAGDGLVLEINDFNKYKDDFNSRLEQNNHDIDVLMKVLAGLQKTNVSCQEVLKDPKSTDELVHQACSHLFDGNSDKGSLDHTGTGGASRN